MTRLIICGLFLSLNVIASQAVKCYECAYIEGFNEPNLNKNCVDKIGSGTVQLEEGIACIKAQGHHGPHSFTMRLAYRPGSYQGKNVLPVGQGSTTCHAANITLNRVGGKIINSLDVCQVCHNEDACNGSGRVQFNYFFWVAILIIVQRFY